MFGDILHGLCLLVLATYVCRNRAALLKENSILAPLVQVRYMLLLMGFFSTYNGLIYNDYAGMNLNLFGTCYKVNGTGNHNHLPQFDVYRQTCTYPFGIDPAWQGSLTFVNSLKMKLSVIIGYLHMSLGLILMALNHQYNSNTLGLFCKFVPQMLFLTCTFGYMDVLIITKWLQVWEPSSTAPSIINTMISMVLGLGRVEGVNLFYGQSTLQLTFIIVAIICVPWMWLP